VRAGYAMHDHADAAAALLPARGQMDVVLGGIILDGEDVAQVGLVHMQRSLPTPASLPTLLHAPAPTASPAPTPTESPATQPTPTWDVTAPSPGGGVVGMGPLTLPILGLGGIILSGVIIASIMFIRTLHVRKRYGNYYYRRDYEQLKRYLDDGSTEGVGVVWEHDEEALPHRTDSTMPPTEAEGS
jgi:hypothetical protein